MNKRLKQLGDQAGVCPIKHVGGGEWDSYLPEAEQKFAELIVKECAEIALREDHDPHECILKHFGVEE
jgi:hypothetical protein